MKKKQYKTELKKHQIELVHLQRHVREKGLKVVILFEGRDAAGKGGCIKRLTEKLNPNHVKVIARGKPTPDEEAQWYFQRWIKDLPAKGEIVIFDRSWYTRAGVESVMGFASKTEVNTFLNNVTRFEKMLVKEGIIVLKYWFSITQRTQEQRFHERLNDLTKQWKLSPMDLESRTRWDEYTKAKERMFRKSHTDACPWRIVDFNNKKRGRIDCFADILSAIPYESKSHEPKRLPHIFPSTEVSNEFDHLKVNTHSREQTDVRENNNSKPRDAREDSTEPSQRGPNPDS